MSDVRLAPAAEGSLGQIFVRRRDHHGRVTFYPVCRIAEGFCSLLRQKTLTADDVEFIKALGFLVKTKEEIL